MTQKNFKRVILYARQLRANQDVSETLRHLAIFLQKQPIESYVDPDTAHCFDLNLPILARDELKKDHDLIVVVGGDGSLLSAARIAIEANVPVIGVNRGHLGFLTDLSPQEIESQLSAVIAGQYTEEHRSLLYAYIHPAHHNSAMPIDGNALNDVVLSRGSETRLISFDVLIDNQFVSHYRADGLIIATPTGSTAYALSAGGPIMHPQLDAIVMVPMFSHSLSSRPLVIDGKSTINLQISEQNEHDIQISCDGHETSIIRPGQHITVQKNKRQLRLLHPMDYRYYDTLRIKLGWGSTG